MSDAVQLAVIDAAKVIIPAVMSLAGMSVTAFFSYRAAQAAHESLQVSKEIKEQTNGMTEHLVALNRKDAHAEGKLEGLADQRPSA